MNNKLTSRQHGKEIFQMVALCPAKNLLNWRKNEVEGYNGVYESHFFLRDSSRCWLQLKLDVESDLLFCILRKVCSARERETEG